MGKITLKIERRVNLICKRSLHKKSGTRFSNMLNFHRLRIELSASGYKAKLSLTVDEIKSKMIELESKRKEFVDTGILEEEQDDIGIHDLLDAITESNRQNLSLYAIDTEEKLNALSSLSSSINLFRNLIDKNFNNKRIVFNKDYGFRFVATYSDSTILPQSLSSGEQHELVMFY